MDWFTDDLNVSHNQFSVQRRKALHHQGERPNGNIDSVVCSGCNRRRRPPFQLGQVLTRWLPAERLHPPLYLPLETDHQALNREISA